MGISTVAVYAEPDRDAVFVKMADAAVNIGPANPMRSYLNIEAILRATAMTGADAIHPGYGFLSESAGFAEAVAQSGLVWVGPSPEILKVIESKCRCRHLADSVDVPFIPGTLDTVRNAAEVIEYGREHGYPLFLKLDKGGGGKGIEIVRSENEVEDVFKRACSIGQAAFRDSACYIEEVVPKPRHIEVQFLADNYGNVVCLGERECSIQRRYQKIIEESPSPIVTDQDRRMLFEYSRRLIRRMKYRGAGTFEGLRSEDGHYYFMEVNARLQVEHPVTEMVTGIDIVKWQLKIAAGEPLTFSQEDVRLRGHAIEARVYAEDPDTFLPSPGRITRLALPDTHSHIRIDHGLAEGCTVPPFYDALLAKVIAWDEDRNRSRKLLIEALNEMRIEGIKTTIATNVKILNHQRFRSGDFTTEVISELLG